MAAAFVGKWDLTETTNIAEIMKATGIKNEFLDLAQKMQADNDEVIEEIAISGDKIDITYYRNRTKEDAESIVLGKEAETETMDGRKVKVLAKIEGDKLIFTESGPFDCITTMTVNGDTATTTIVCGGVTANVTLKKL